MTGRHIIVPPPAVSGDPVHAVAALDLPGLKPAPLAGVVEPIFDRLKPGDLLIDATYQRGLSRSSLRLIRSIVQSWDWLKFKPPVVAMTERGFEVVDGQHTAIAAACHPEITTIPVVVVDGSDLARRASAFVSHAVARVAATPAQVWHAAMAAGDDDATTIRQVLDRAGVTVLPHPPTDGVYGINETLSLGAMRRLVDKRGAMRAREVLDLVAAAELAPITADHIRVAESLLLDAEIAFAKRMPVWRALTAVLYRAHAASKRGRAKAAEAA